LPLGREAWRVWPMRGACGVGSQVRLAQLAGPPRVLGGVLAAHRVRAAEPLVDRLHPLWPWPRRWLWPTLPRCGAAGPSGQAVWPLQACPQPTAGDCPMGTVAGAPGAEAPGADAALGSSLGRMLGRMPDRSMVPRVTGTSMGVAMGAATGAVDAGAAGASAASAPTAVPTHNQPNASVRSHQPVERPVGRGWLASRAAWVCVMRGLHRGYSSISVVGASN
jgi:hypothetical protein